jgi:hypothetical protein
MKIAYRELKNLKPKSKKLLAQILPILEEYYAQGYRMSLRQLYYQLVAANVFPNIHRSYVRLSDLLGEARMAGILDWNSIEDRIRVPKFPNEWTNAEGGMKHLIKIYRRRRWWNQSQYVEVWCEKDALSGVLLRITYAYHVRLLVNRGYSSISAMHDAALRFRRAEEKGKECHVIYVGDHDPSGEQMVEDIIHRLGEFRTNVQVTKIALTREQIEAYNLPPNPVKWKDPRARGYIAEHGNVSWEVDALPPSVLNQILTDELDKHIDRELYERQIKCELRDKKLMRKFIKSIKSER